MEKTDGSGGYLQKEGLPDLPVTIGTTLPLPDNYIGPDGMCAVMVLSFVPPDTLVFVKNFKVVEIWTRETMARVDDPHIEATNMSGKYDAILCSPTCSPEKIMGQDWMDEAIKDSRKVLN